MIKTVDQYLSQLKTALRECDPATIQDALADAEEHLRTALEEFPQESESACLPSIIEKYGSPEETASAYREIDFRLSPAPINKFNNQKKGYLNRFFSILSDFRAWGAFLYFTLTPLTGTLFGIWTATGTMLSLFSLIFIIGIPLAGLFLLSARGIGLLEGRIIEALLGTRMPRRPIFISRNLSPASKLKILLTEISTWKTIIYLILLFPLGFLYFFSSIIPIILSLSFILSPLLELVFLLPLEIFGYGHFTPVWLLPVISISGLFLLPASFHFVRLLGKTHARFAKFMLVHKDAFFCSEIEKSHPVRSTETEKGE